VPWLTGGGVWGARGVHFFPRFTPLSHHGLRGFLGGAEPSAVGGAFSPVAAFLAGAWRAFLAAGASAASFAAVRLRFATGAVAELADGPAALRLVVFNTAAPCAGAPNSSDDAPGSCGHAFGAGSYVGA
jgi:hypothetical protein